MTDLQDAVADFHAITEQAARIDSAGKTAALLRAQAAQRVVDLAGSQTQAARELDIDPSTLNKLLRRLTDNFQEIGAALQQIGAAAAGFQEALETLSKLLPGEDGQDHEFGEPAALEGRVPEPELVPTRDK